MDIASSLEDQPDKLNAASVLDPLPVTSTKMRNAAQLHQDLHQLLNCSCDQCAVPASGNDDFKKSFFLIAPALCSLFFILFAVGAIVQIWTVSEKGVSQAKLLCDSGKYQESADLSLAALRLNPFSTRAYCERARALVHMMRYHEAEECLNSALSCDPDCKTALESRAALCVRLDKPAQTIADSNRLASLSGGLTVCQYGNLAIAYYKNKNFEMALKTYDKALAANKHSLTMQLGRAYCLYGKQQHKEALASCEQLLSQYGRQGKILILSAYCRNRLHDSEGALRDLTAAIDLEPKNAIYHANRAAIYAQLHKANLALDDYKMAAALDGCNAAVQLAAGRAARESGDILGALKYYDRLAQNSSFNQSADQLKERANINFSLGHYNQALVDINRAITIAPTGDTIALQALTLAHCGRIAAARDAMVHAVALAPDSEHVAIADAQMQIVLGQSYSAIDKYSSLLASHPDCKEALVGRGLCYFNRGQWASAAHDFDQAVALGASDDDISRHLQKCRSILASGAKVKLDLPQSKIVDLAKIATADLNRDGIQAATAGDVHLANIYFAELVRREPASVEARIKLARSLEAEGEHKDAIAMFEPLSQAERLSLADQSIYAHALAASGLHERAMSIMQRLIAIEPTNVSYRLELIKIISAAGQIDRAITLCREALTQPVAGTDRRNLNNVYESLITERLRGHQESAGLKDLYPTRGQSEG